MSTNEMGSSSSKTLVTDKNNQANASARQTNKQANVGGRNSKTGQTKMPTDNEKVVEKNNKQQKGKDNSQKQGKQNDQPKTNTSTSQKEAASTQNPPIRTQTMSQEKSTSQKNLTQNNISRQNPDKVLAANTDIQKHPSINTSTDKTPRQQYENHPVNKKSTQSPRQKGGTDQDGFHHYSKYGEDEYGYTNESEESRNRISIEREKIETHLRSSRVPETKIRPLAAKISQETKKDHMNTPREFNSDVSKILRRIINKNMDTMLYGSPHKTNLQSIEYNEALLAQKASEMADLLESDLKICMDGIHGRENKNSSHGKSMPIQIRNAMQQLETDADILHKKNEELGREKDAADIETRQTRTKVDTLETSTFELEREQRRLEEENRRLSHEVEESRDERRKLESAIQQVELENSKLKKQAEKLLEANRVMKKDAENVQALCARLNVLVSEQAKEISRLRDPDKEMVYKIQRLESELAESMTANRRLELEKGALRSTLQKLQVTYDSTLKERGTLVKEKRQLQKENEIIKTTNKKLILSHH